MSTINVMLFRKSLFYAPIILACEGPFLRKHGLEPALTVASADRTVRGSLLDGTVDVGQGAVSQSWPLLEKNVEPGVLHFAQINCRDGFFLVGRKSQKFDWQDLHGAKVLVDHGAQPLVSFKHACRAQKVDYDKLIAIDAGGEQAALSAFRRGEGDFVHLQAPAAHEAVASGGIIAASVGEAIGPIAFTSLMATKRWLETPMARGFLKGMSEAKFAMNESRPEELAELLHGAFPDASHKLLVEGIAAYQALGTWAGPLHIPADEYNEAQQAFLAAGSITRLHEYDRLIHDTAHELAA